MPTGISAGRVESWPVTQPVWLCCRKQSGTGRGRTKFPNRGFSSLIRMILWRSVAGETQNWAQDLASKWKRMIFSNTGLNRSFEVPILFSNWSLGKIGWSAVRLPKDIPAVSARISLEVLKECTIAGAPLLLYTVQHVCSSALAQLCWPMQRNKDPTLLEYY